MLDRPSTLLKRAMTATEVVAELAQLEGWRLAGDGRQVAIEKTFNFANYFETIAFVNAVAFIAHAQNHHPDLSVHFGHCLVQLSTHDVGGLSLADFESAARIDALLA